MKFKDKVVLITGSSRGIGKACALIFAQEGANIVINSRTSSEEAKEVVSKIEKLGRKAIYIQADITKTDEVENLFVKTLETFERLDILVNNAGIHRPKDFFELTYEDWKKMLDTNLVGLFLCSQNAASIMKEQKSGKIINIASVRGLDYCGRPGNIDYSASKAGVISFTRTLAKHLAPNVQVNAVAPGPVDTGINIWTDKDLEKTYLKRLIKPEEIAKSVLFLASADADVINGEILVVDGGYSLI